MIDSKRPSGDGAAVHILYVLGGSDGYRFALPDEIDAGWSMVCQSSRILDGDCTTIEVMPAG